MAAEEDRPRILYADSGPESPFPLKMEGAVISGFGRGSKELGIPTANLPVDEAATPWIADAKSGVYFGYASLALPSSHPDRDEGKTPRHRSNPRAPVDAPPASTTTTTTTTTEASKEEGEEAPRHWQIYPMVMSIGYNPFYKNSVRSAEVHILHEFASDFYGAPLRLMILGYVRAERDYASLDALVRDINIDCEVARDSLARPAWTPRQGTVGGSAAAAGELDGAWLVRE